MREALVAVLLLALPPLVACAPRVVMSQPAGADPAPAAAPGFDVHGIALPGAGAHGVFMDYIVFDPHTQRAWIPAGDTGSVDVIDAADDKLTRIEGFVTAEMEHHGKKRTIGPSSATVGNGVVYVGNRGDSSVCAIDARTLSRGGCATLDSMPDGVAYVAATHEVWVTTPRDKSLTILDVASPLAPIVKGKISLAGEPEGSAVDDARGIFYTNLEDTDRTLAVDLERHTIVSTWQPDCGEDGPKGLALDQALDLLIVACPDHLETLDAGHGGKLLGKLAVGDGLDNIDYVAARHEVYAAAGKAGILTIVSLAASGELVATATVKTATGARNAVASPAGVIYLTDSAAGKILVVKAAR